MSELVEEAILRVMECRVAGRRVAIPVAAVDRVVEYQLASSLPFAPDWSDTLGLHEGEPVLSVDVARRSGARGEVTGVLLAGAPGVVRRVLRVDSVVGFGAVAAAARRPSEELPWLREHARPTSAAGTGGPDDALLVIDPVALGVALEGA